MVQVAASTDHVLVVGVTAACVGCHHAVGMWPDHPWIDASATTLWHRDHRWMIAQVETAVGDLHPFVVAAGSDWHAELAFNEQGETMMCPNHPDRVAARLQHGELVFVLRRWTDNRSFADTVIKVAASDVISGPFFTGAGA